MFPFVQRRDGGPELVIRRKDAVIPMPVLARRRHEIGEPVEELKRRELDDAIGSRPRGLPPTTPPDTVGRLVPREHVADFGDAAVWAASHGESLQCKGGPGKGAQQVFEVLPIDTQLETKERDPDTGVDGKPAVLPGEHVGCRRSVEQVSEPEPADHAAAYPLGDRGQISLSDWPPGQERRRAAAACYANSRHEDAVGCTHVQMHVVVQRRAAGGRLRGRRRQSSRLPQRSAAARSQQKISS